MKFTNLTNVETRSLRRLVAKIARQALIPAEYKNLSVIVKPHRRSFHTFNYWHTFSHNGALHGKFELKIHKGTPLDPRQIARLIARAIGAGYKSKIVETDSFADQFPLTWKTKRETELQGDRDAQKYEEKSNKRVKDIKRKITQLEDRMKARAARIKRATTQQKKDERRLKYFRKMQITANEVLDLASAEAALEQEAAEERETENFRRPPA